jgi:hypothetical protein
VERLAIAKGMKLLPFVKSACPSATISIASVQLGPHYSQCDRWRANSLATIKRTRPSLVIVSNDTSFVSTDPANWQVTPAQWEVGLRKTLSSLAESGAHVLVITDVPQPLRGGASCLARQAWSPLFGGTCTYRLSAAFNRPAQRAEANAVADVPRARAVSLNDAICDTAVCGAERNGMVMYRDTGHLTVEFAGSLGPLLIERSNAAF